MKFMTENQLDEKIEFWLRGLELPGSSKTRINKPALLILDMQNEFLHESGQMPVWSGPAIINRVKKLLQAFREANLPVFFTRHLCIEPYRHINELETMKNVAQPENFLRDGCSGAAIIPDLAPIEGEQVITKYRYSAFYDTPLDTLLKVNKIEDVLITGVATNICCEATAHDAFFRGYNVCFTIDGTGGTSETAHLSSLTNIKLAYGSLVTVDQLISEIEG